MFRDFGKSTDMVATDFVKLHFKETYGWFLTLQVIISDFSIFPWIVRKSKKNLNFHEKCLNNAWNKRVEKILPLKNTKY